MVVKCTAAIFFRTADSRGYFSLCSKRFGAVPSTRAGRGWRKKGRKRLQTNPGIKMCKKKVDFFISLISHSP